MTEPNKKEPLSRWYTWYLLVAVFLVALIILFYQFTKTFS